MLRAENVLSPARLKALYAMLGIEEPPRPSKYRSKRVPLDGYCFASRLEAKVYTMLKWQYLGGLITEPLLQVRFSLGPHYGKDRIYIADFVFIEHKSGELVIADAKGHLTKEYLRNRAMIYSLYRICIREYTDRDV